MIFRFPSAIVRPFGHAAVRNVTSLSIRLPKLIRLPNGFHSTTTTVANFKRVLLTFGSRATTCKRKGAILLGPRVINQNLMGNGVLPTFNVRLFRHHGGLLLNGQMVFIQRASVPRGVAIAKFQGGFTTKRLHIVVVKPCHGGLRLANNAIRVRLRVIILALPRSKGIAILRQCAFNLIKRLMVIQVRIRTIIPRVVSHREITIIVFRVFTTRATSDPSPTKVGTTRNILLMAIVSTMLLHVCLSVLPTPQGRRTTVPMF